MTIYTITITPEGSATTTTLRLDTADGETVVTDVHLHAGTGLPPGQLPTIDYDLLLRAVTAAATPAPIPTPATPARAPGEAGRRGATRTARKQTAAAAARSRRAETGAGAGTATARKRAGKGTAAPAAEPTGGRRAYRRMPTDFADVQQRVGSSTALAEHYRVPRHTINGWLRRLREQS
jgi:hypothetical protein